MGIQAQGRTTILRVNYRNTNEILDCAFRFAEDVLQPQDRDEDGIPLVKPEMAGRHGAVPKILRADSVYDEAEEIRRELQRAHDSGTPWKDMAVLFPAHFVGDEIGIALQKAQVPYERLERNSASRKYKAGEDSVKIMTMHSSKGLEFPVVAIAGLGFMPYRTDQATDDARLLYVAMTRATETLVMTASRKSAFVERLMEVGFAA